VIEFPWLENFKFEISNLKSERSPWPTEPRGTSHLGLFRIVSDIDTSTARFSINCIQAEGCTVIVESYPICPTVILEF